MRWLRHKLTVWLGIPMTPPKVNPQLAGDMQALRDRMDSLERLLMTELQKPEPSTALDAGFEEGVLASLPDAHLGAQ